MSTSHNSDSPQDKLAISKVSAEHEWSQQSGHELTISKQNLTSDDKSIVILIWVLSLFFSFFPALIVFFAINDKPFVKQGSKEILNFQITIVIFSILNLVLAVVFAWTIAVPVIAWILGVIVAISYIVFCIVGAIKASKGEIYKVPLVLRLIK